MGYYDDIRKVVCRIPRGEVATYGEVARAAGHPGTARQVAWALRDADVRGIPWHRVLGSRGTILLPDQAGLLQRRLLEREGVRFAGARVDLAHHAFQFPPQRPCRRQR
ncbi:MAG: MGMT family protein [Acidobacteriia bacterium]|nr:MGMT family protein [Terriglobia bacterium]